MAGIFAVICLPSRAQQSPYIHKVYDYRPAPGQFVNKLPEYAPDDTQAEMNRKVEELIAGVYHNEGMITLGGYGGYVVFGFDHEVMNVAGKYDFRILGNAFYANNNPNGEASREGGSCEPGIVMVSRDVNGNGLPDDPWYELAGSEYRQPQTLRDYQITYYKPDENKQRTPDPNYPYINDLTYIRWSTNGHGEGYVYRNTFHNQSYYPQWIAGETLSFRGTKLADNYVVESVQGQERLYVQYAYHWGYVDNQPNNDPRSGFNIEWAVDDSGTPVQLSGIHFVKVYTGVNQYCGWLGETSTEIAGAEDLHLTDADADVPVFVSGVALSRTSVELHPGETAALTATITPANATNRSITWRSGATAVATVSNAGIVTAVATGTAVIQAITNDGYHIATCQVAVRTNSTDPDPDPGPQPVAVAGVVLDRSQLELSPGDVWTLSATVLPQNATNPAVAWRSSNPAVAEVMTGGIVVASSAGEATITVTTADGGFTATCRVRVTANATPGAVAVSSVALSVAQAVLQPGETLRLVATVLPQNATNKAVAWRSSNPAVAEVTVNGTVVAFAAGTATITVTTADRGLTATCSVTVGTPMATGRPAVAAGLAWYAAGGVHLRNLEGYDCTLASLAGQTLHTFRASSPDERVVLPLPRGIYLLIARRNGERRTFYITVNSQ
jgi:uncharacterized protein YjdB